MCIGATTMAQAEEQVLRVTNFGEYIAPETVPQFEQETGIRVIYDTYDSLEAIDAKLLAGNSGYDVVLHAASNAARLIHAEILMPFDKEKLPNFKHIMPEIAAQLSSEWDPGNNHLAPYSFGTHGVTYNKKMVLQAHPEAPIGSMDLIFDQQHLKKVASCGVALLDSPTDIVPMALAHLGLPPNTKNTRDYDAAAELLRSIRPHIKTFDNYAYQRMPQKEFCVAVTWGPDALFATLGAEEAGTGVTLDFFIPPGAGKAMVWVDGWVIPRDADNVEAAHTFINFMMRPDIAAANANFTFYASANEGARASIDPLVTSNEGSYPPKDVLASMYTLQPLPLKAERKRTRVWTDFKAGE